MRPPHTIPMRLKLVRLLASAALMMACTATHALDFTRPIADGEMARLPDFCPHTMGNNKESEDPNKLGPGADKWIAKMGGVRNFKSMHHYCRAVVREHRSRAPGLSHSEREYVLGTAIDEYTYVITNTTRDFIMLPDIFVRMGDDLVLLKRHGQAAEAFLAAVRQKPDYWRAYSRWADYLVATGQRGAAIAKLEEGLRALPDEPRLREQYKGLGGNVDKFLLTVPKPAAPAASAASEMSAPGATVDAAAPAAAASAP